ncbi:hypothetical protein V1290_005456 [Bradyrhizobium sp. AZCC 1578]|uniref:hypothetical protein n=1 Tax=Bradyrhizobium sp. AZCC 1578 TaxID=3117027 RepID=UPI002FF3DD7B
MKNAFLALTAAALLVLVASATALVNDTGALSVSPTSRAIARDVGDIQRPAGQGLLGETVHG